MKLVINIVINAVLKVSKWLTYYTEPLQVIYNRSNEVMHDKLSS